MTAGRRGAHYPVTGIGQNGLTISSHNHLASTLAIYMPPSPFEQAHMFLIPSRKFDCLKLEFDPAGYIPAPQCFSDEVANQGTGKTLLDVFAMVVKFVKRD